MRRCWLCGRNGSEDQLDTHHIFGGAYRDKSDRLGLVVPLCHKRCHIFGKDAVHRNAETMRELRKWGQIKAMKEQDWTIEQFIDEFGKNYLEEEQKEFEEEKKLIEEADRRACDLFAAWTDSLSEEEKQQYVPSDERSAFDNDGFVAK